MPRSQHRIAEADIVAADIYGRERAERRKVLIPLKRRRRVEVGPYATFYFENYDTMLVSATRCRCERPSQLGGRTGACRPVVWTRPSKQKKQADGPS